MAGAGGQLVQLGQQLYIAQGEVELARAQAEDADAINKMFLDFQKENDPETLSYLIESNWQTIRQVTNKLREAEEIRHHKKIIFVY